MKYATIIAFTGAALAAPGVFTTTPTPTVTSSPVSTVYTFVSGNPPASSSRAAAADATSSATVVSVTTKTYYPCATPFPSLTPSLPYGDASLPENFTTENSLFSIESTAEGASAEACCNACFFQLSNCIQAYWYSYEGCVVSLATNASLAGSASGEQVSTVCPAGTFNGLSYANDTNPAFRSTGNIAGPCGQTYDNL